MYNFKVSLPNIVKTVKDYNSVFDENFALEDKNKSKSFNKKNDDDIREKGSEQTSHELLIKSQLLATKQKALKEVNEINFLTNKILLEIDNNSRQRMEYIKEIYNQVSTLVMAIVEKIIYNKINVDESFIAQIVTNALQSTQNEQDIIVQVNPDDKKLLEKYWHKILKAQNRIAAIELEGNPAISKGGCLLKTSHGSIDAQIENQLSVIEKLLVKHYSGVVYEFD